jgi:hypothetical protein
METTAMAEHMYTVGMGIAPLPGANRVPAIIMERITLIGRGEIETIKRLDRRLVEAKSIKLKQERKAALRDIAEQYRNHGMPAKAQEIKGAINASHTGRRKQTFAAHTPD